MTTTCYVETFFAGHREGSRLSALKVLPVVFRLVRPMSVVDVGCGVGTWLTVAKELGAENVLGLDGPYVRQSRLEICEHEFLEADLSEPPPLNERFDLALCLEVAEHLPPSSAVSLVRFLTELAPLVLFSAAVPGQRGMRHVNEQWPSYWQGLFADRGFVFLDCLRGRFWNDSDVEPWYVQNLLLAISCGYLSTHPKFVEEAVGPAPLDIAHPICFDRRQYINVRDLPKFVCTTISRSLSYRLNRKFGTPHSMLNRQSI
jgi:SAM-dependent methyltransferase